MLLLQNTIPPDGLTAADGFSIGQKVISGLLGFISVLIWYIWNQSQKSSMDRHAELKMMAEKRHEDTMRLYKALDERQDKLEKEHHDYRWELHFFRGFINRLQGKDIEYDNPRPDRPNKL